MYSENSIRFDRKDYVRTEYITDVDLYAMTPHELFIVRCMIELLDNNWTLREAAKNLVVSKSTLHRWIHDDVRHISTELYDRLLTLMRNHRNRR